jgi:predicted extracellular nuclease
MMKNSLLAFGLMLLVFACQPPASSDQEADSFQAVDDAARPGLRSALHPDFSAPEPTDKELKVAFYNVENLFDTQDDPNKIDEEFLPGSELNWTLPKYNSKQSSIARVINAIQPDLLGLAEVENARVLDDLLSQQLIADKAYRYLHEESPDQRGIDVAFVYRPEAFKYLSHKAVRVDFPQEPEYTSRDFLIVTGELAGGEKLHVIVNHWPSRRGGQMESEPRRLRVASLVREQIDQIFAQEKDANIILMGDFNDDPLNLSLIEGIEAEPDLADLPDDGFFNPMADLLDPDSYGTLTYRGKWNLFDQFILSENLTLQENEVTYQANSARAFNAEWLRVGFGRSAEAPRRAIFRGEYQKEGFSDHFPIEMELVVE